MSSWEDVQGYITTSQVEGLRFRIERGDGEKTFDIVPQTTVVKNIFGQERTLRLVGIQPQEEIILIRHGPVESISLAREQLSQVVTLTFRSLYYVVTGAVPARDALAGPIRIFDVIKDAAVMGFSSLVYIMAIISASLGIFNLFPVPVLDGGHLFLFLIEGLRRRPLPVKMEEGLTRFGFGLLMCLMAFVLINDVIEVGWVEKAMNLIQKWQP